MIFRKSKKEKEIDKLTMDDDELIDFDETGGLDEDNETRDATREELASLDKEFIYHITGGCPICGSDVKGNDYYKYFCEKCNLLFEKKDVIDKEFGKTVREGVRKTMLTDEERAILEKKRKELSEKVKKEFSERKDKQAPKSEPVQEHKPLPKPEPEPEEEKVEEVEAEIIPPFESEEDDLEQQETKSLEEALGAAHAIRKQTREQPQEPEEETAEPDEDEGETAEPTEPEQEEETEERPLKEKEEYALDSPDRILASKESTKMHVGDCHFVKKIHPDNRIYLMSQEQGKEQGYEPCVCLRRRKSTKSMDR